MVTRETHDIDPAEVLRVVAEVSAGFDATLTPTERAALEKMSANDGDQGLVYSTIEREQAMEDFEMLAAADSLQILADKIHATVQQREQELYRKCLEAYYVAEELAQDPANAHIVPHVEAMRKSHIASYGKPIPAKK